VCAGAGYALKLAAFDPCVKAFVGIAGFYPSPQLIRETIGEENYRNQLRQLAEVAQRQSCRRHVPDPGSDHPRQRTTSHARSAERKRSMTD
jgi:hypothetical protein